MPSRSAGRRALLGLAAVAAATGLSACAGHAPAEYSGATWRVMHIDRTPGGSLDLSRAHTASITFANGGLLLLRDGVANYRLSYRADGSGFAPSGYNGSFGWYDSRPDEDVDGALTSVLSSPSVSVHVDGARRRAIFSTGTYTVTCRRSR